MHYHVSLGFVDSPLWEKYDFENLDESIDKFLRLGLAVRAPAIARPFYERENLINSAEHWQSYLLESTQFRIIWYKCRCKEKK